MLDGRPTLEQVQHTLPWFLESSPGMHCAKGGRGAYDSALAMEGGVVAGLERGVVSASAFRANNVPLATQQDFIGALQVRVTVCLLRVRHDVLPCAPCHLPMNHRRLGRWRSRCHRHWA